MQAAIVVASPVPSSAAFLKNSISQTSATSSCCSSRAAAPRSCAAVSRRRSGMACYAQQQDQDSYVKYDEKKSVFPAEACEEVGGESCEVEGIGPEVKGSTAASSKPRVSSPVSGEDRDYVEYDKQAKTVFPGEACDELGGEFCESEYQAGVFPDKAGATK